MMPEIERAMLAVGSSPAASIVAKVTVTTALALLGARLARGGRAAVRHALLAAGFGILLALPLVSIVAAPVRISVPTAVEAPAGSAITAIAAISTRAPANATVDAAHPNSRSFMLSASVLLFAGWSLGAALFLLPMAAGLLQVRSFRRSGQAWPHGQSIVDRLALEAGIHRRVEALLHEALPGPMTCGIAHPAIVLPLDAQNWEGEDLNRAMVHELEHVRRGDWVIHCFARALCAAYWFHPLVWIAWRQLALEAERSCDDAVLGRSEATAYADQLVGLARRLSSAAKTRSAKSPVLAMANRADLTTRVGAVLDSRQRRGRAGALSVALASAAAAALVLTLSPLRVVAAQQAAGTDAGLIATAQIAANTNLVIETAIVSGPSGRAIEGLKASDFTLTEDGVAQTISIFEFQKLNGALQGKRDAVSSYYILGYYTQNQNVDGKFRKVEIAVKNNPGATLKYRAGYYAAKSFISSGSAHGSAGSGKVVSVATLGPSPLLLHKVDAEYSEEARKAKFQGTVVLNVEVDASGQVTDARAIKSLGLGLDQKAIDAVKHWRFKPATNFGKPVPSHVEVAFDFRLL